MVKHGTYLHWHILNFNFSKFLLTSLICLLEDYIYTLFYLWVSCWYPRVFLLKTWYWTYTHSQTLYTELSLYICVLIIYQKNCTDIWNIELYIAILYLEAQLNSTIYSSDLFEYIFLPFVKLRRFMFISSLLRNVFLYNKWLWNSITYRFMLLWKKIIWCSSIYWCRNPSLNVLMLNPIYILTCSVVMM